MITAEHELHLVRPKVIEHLSRLRAAGASKMDAYARIGDMVGKSDTWVRKIIGRQPDAGVRLRDALNLGITYADICAFVEGSAGRVERLNEHLRGEAHEVDQGAVAPVAGAPGSAGERRGVVPPVASEGRS